MYKIVVADDNDKGKWDKFIQSHEDSGPYHLFGWKHALEKVYHHRAYYLMAEGEHAEIHGVLPLVFVKPPVIKGTLVSLPFCDYGGILSSCSDATTQLVKYALDLAEVLDARLELRYKHPEVVLSNSGPLGVMSHKVRMILSLMNGSESLWNGFKSKLRSQIKRAIKEHLEFRLGSLELLDDFYKVFRINMRDLGSPVHSRTYISSILSTYGMSAHVGVVFYEDEPVASGIILDHRDTVSIPWASSLSAYNRFSPNMLLYWGFLRYASDNGFRIFDFGRSTVGEGTYKFKEQWGCTPVPLYWYGEGFSEKRQPALSAGRTRKIMEQTWSKLPQRFVDFCGPAVRRYITL